MKKLLPIPMLFLTACTSTPIDLADAGTTAVAVAQGATEANPIVGIAGDAAAPVVSLAVKHVAKKALQKQGYSECVSEGLVGLGSAYGTGANIAVILGASTPVTLLAGIGAVMAYERSKDCSHDP